VDLIPNGEKLQCLNCHRRPAGGEDRNPFGQAVLDIVGGRKCIEFWRPELAAMDSDGDGRTNGEELGDPAGVWKPGDPDPGDPALVTPPGVDEAAFPKLEIVTVEPAEVSAAGGSRVKVRGASFMPGTVIRIGASELADQVVAGPALIHGAAPALGPTETPGPRDVAAADERGVAILAGGISYVAEPAPRRSPLRGDVDADGAVEVSDAVALVLSLLEGGALPSLAAADADGSTTVDILDAVLILVELSLGELPAA
jgi:hypothetical protein